MIRSAMVKCPYCEHRNMVDVRDDYAQKQVVTCALDEGGCDRDFVADIRVSIIVDSLRIEGQDERNR